MDIPFLKKEEKKEPEMRDCPICRHACDLHPALRKQITLVEEFKNDMATLRDKWGERGLKSFVITFSVLMPVDTDETHTLNSNGYITHIPIGSWAHLEKHKGILSRAMERIKFISPVEEIKDEPPRVDGDFELI